MDPIVLRLDGAVIMALEFAFADAPENAPVAYSLYFNRPRGQTASRRCDLELPLNAAYAISDYLASRSSSLPGHYFGSLRIEEILEKWQAALASRLN